MKLISCDGCGLVYDQDNIDFPEIEDENFDIISDNCEWNSDEEGFVAIVKCFCGNSIMREK